MGDDLQDVLLWQQPARTDGETGQRLVGWEDVGTQRCSVTAVGGNERMYADQPTPEHSHRIKVRARTRDIKHDWRAVWKGRVLNVVVAPPCNTGDDWQVILCQEQAPTTANS